MGAAYQNTRKCVNINQHVSKLSSRIFTYLKHTIESKMLEKINCFNYKSLIMCRCIILYCGNLIRSVINLDIARIQAAPFCSKICLYTVWAVKLKKIAVYILLFIGVNMKRKVINSCVYINLAYTYKYTRIENKSMIIIISFIFYVLHTNSHIACAGCLC